MTTESDSVCTRRDNILIRLIGLIAIAAGLVARVPASAQSAAKIPRLGVLWPTTPPPPINPKMAALLRNLHDLGWQEGKTVAIEYRYGGNDASGLAGFANELVRLKVDVITTLGDLSTRSAQQATATVPIVPLGVFLAGIGRLVSISQVGLPEPAAVWRGYRVASARCHHCCPAHHQSGRPYANINRMNGNEMTI